MIFEIHALYLGLFLCHLGYLYVEFNLVYKGFVVCITEGYVELVVAVARLFGVKKQIGDSI